MAVTDNSSIASLVELLHGLEEDQLFLEYQGVFDVRTRSVRGAEALIRWNHPERGLLPPADFLAIAMRGGLGGLVTELVLDRATGQCAAWRLKGYDIPVSVNVSAAAFAGKDLPAAVANSLERHQIPPDRLTVEVTEHACAVENTELRDTFTALARLGVRLSLDDFGMGESSLSRLQQLQFDEVKIDRSFVSNICSEPTDRNIVDFTTRLAHSLGMKVVAEGVETAEVLEALGELGSDLAQGFHLHRPARPDAFPCATMAQAQRPREDREGGTAFPAC
ncbi:MAG TPA: EAL domain-containing protein [Acidimicrobiales bacterium]|jgi:EAL domain-containing protein (putative c-di-GMP-specific phosphodiesterase class I)|nr:EAL domain-containing protein [Acidimicrobiales bacterium]